MDRSRESPLNPTESRFARGLNESFATHSPRKRTLPATSVANAAHECGCVSYGISYTIISSAMPRSAARFATGLSLLVSKSVEVCACSTTGPVA
jgi:hypothetical protein